MTAAQGVLARMPFRVCSVVLCVLVLVLFLFPYCQGSSFASGRTSQGCGGAPRC